MKRCIGPFPTVAKCGLILSFTEKGCIVVYFRDIVYYIEWLLSRRKLQMRWYEIILHFSVSYCYLMCKSERELETIMFENLITHLEGQLHSEKFFFHLSIIHKHQNYFNTKFGKYNLYLLYRSSRKSVWLSFMRCF